MSATPRNRAKDRLIIPALKSLCVGVAALGLLLFLPAGTLDYWQAWALIAVFVLGSNAIGIYLSLHDPELLERREHQGVPGPEGHFHRTVRPGAASDV